MTEAQAIYLGVDTGGTFTDFVAVSGDQVRIHKCLSTPDQPERAILDGITALGLQGAVDDGRLHVVHGTTVATNAALEGKGVRTVYIGNRGFTDLLSIGRQHRTELYNLLPQPSTPPVPPELCLAVDCRVDAQGHELRALDTAELQALVQQVKQCQADAVAINLLFSFLNPDAEIAIAEALPDTLFVSRSSEVLPEYKEYERGMATWLNAWIGPRVQSYLNRLQKALGDSPLSVMQSSGGTTDAATAGRRAVNLLLSGPAGGLAAARHLGQRLGQPKLMTFDMGGTSSDVALIDGDIALTTEGRIGPYPVAVPMVDMHTIGAGGGSIAYIDAGGLLRVGPESAGANPGPACYGLGGTSATVTDANVVLGRLPADTRLGGGMPIVADAARAAIASLADAMSLSIEDTAAGIIAIANEHMVRALRVISVQRGFDPAEFALCCFGGAGGLHVCDLAEALGSRQIILPRHGGVFSALGMLLAPRERQLSQTVNQPLTPALAAILRDFQAAMATTGREQLAAEGVHSDQITTHTSLDLCYHGQSYTLNLPWQEDIPALISRFHAHHAERYGHRLNLPVQLINIRVALRAPATLTAMPNHRGSGKSEPDYYSLAGIDTPVPGFDRETLAPGDSLTGPALIREPVASCFVQTGWRAEVDTQGNLHLHRHGD